MQLDVDTTPDMDIATCTPNQLTQAQEEMVILMKFAMLWLSDTSFV